MTAVSAHNVQRAYARVQELLPNLQPLTRDPESKTWSIGHVMIGETAREAQAYLRGLYGGVLTAPFKAAAPSARRAS